jgi:hypothetical protein
MIIKQTNSENPSEHWEFIECEGKVAIDLGCGRWEHVEYRDPSWPTTPEWLLLKGASEVHAYDIDPAEVDWYNTVLAPTKNIKAYEKGITVVQDLREILQAHNPKVVKCDIEGYESTFLELTDEEFKSIDYYALETHSEHLYVCFMEKFNLLGYEIIATVDLTHAPPMKALFAKKK